MFESMYVSFPKFAVIYLFLRVYHPTRLYIDNTTSIAIAILLSYWFGGSVAYDFNLIITLLAVLISSLIYSVPFLISGMVTSIVQQILLLNEQSVQDNRFTEESEALSQFGSNIFLYMCLESGLLFAPLLMILNDSFLSALDTEPLIVIILNLMYVAAILAGKYIIVLIVINFSVASVDLFFKKASLYNAVSPSICAATTIFLISLWLIGDLSYFLQISTEELKNAN